jgi:hypothetical protein
VEEEAEEVEEEEDEEEEEDAYSGGEGVHGREEVCRDVKVCV